MSDQPLEDRLPCHDDKERECRSVVLMTVRLLGGTLSPVGGYKARHDIFIPPGLSAHAGPNANLLFVAFSWHDALAQLRKECPVPDR